MGAVRTRLLMVLHARSTDVMTDTAQKGTMCVERDAHRDGQSADGGGRGEMRRTGTTCKRERDGSSGAMSSLTELVQLWLVRVGPRHLKHVSRQRDTSKLADLGEDGLDEVHLAIWDGRRGHHRRRADARDAAERQAEGCGREEEHADVRGVVRNPRLYPVRERAPWDTHWGKGRK